jgi:hypothetical protein
MRISGKPAWFCGCAPPLHFAPRKHAREPRSYQQLDNQYHFAILRLAENDHTPLLPLICFGQRMAFVELSIKKPSTPRSRVAARLSPRLLVSSSQSCRLTVKPSIYQHGCPNHLLEAPGAWCMAAFLPSQYVSIRRSTRIFHQEVKRAEISFREESNGSL